MDKWLIYLHKNKENNKVYIGQTKNLDPNKRWRNGTHYEGTYFGRAIKKYGWENFEHIILEKNILSREKADQREKFWIALYKSNDPNFGYNLTSGGLSYTANEELREKRSKILKERWKNIEFREQQIERMKEYWKEHPENKRRQKVKCIETNTIFDSYKEAGEWCNLSFPKNSFLSYFRGEKYSCGKHPETKEPLHWIKINEKGEEILNNQNFDIKKSKRGQSSTKKVMCIETGQIFDSLVDATSWCGLKNSSSITNMIKGRKKTAGKHPETKEPLHWKYYIEGENDG